MSTTIYFPGEIRKQEKTCIMDRFFVVVFLNKKESESYLSCM